MTLTRAQQQYAIAGTLGVVLILVYARALGRPTGGQAADAPEISPTAQETSPPAPLPDLLSQAPAAASRSAQAAEAAQARWTRDPFARGAGRGPSGLALAGVMWDGQEPMAMINEQMVRVGDVVEGYTVTSIRVDAVLLTDGTQTLTLTIAP